jgi:phage-related protein
MRIFIQESNGFCELCLNSNFRWICSNEVKYILKWFNQIESWIQKSWKKTKTISSLNIWEIKVTLKIVHFRIIFTAAISQNNYLN